MRISTGKRVGQKETSNSEIKRGDYMGYYAGTYMRLERSVGIHLRKRRKGLVESKRKAEKETLNRLPFRG